jgi:hypothetical protein
MGAVEVKGMPGYVQGSTLFAGHNGHVPDMGYFIGGIATDEDISRVAEFRRFIDGFMYRRIGNNAKFFIVILI